MQMLADLAGMPEPYQPEFASVCLIGASEDGRGQSTRLYSPDLYKPEVRGRVL